MHLIVAFKLFECRRLPHVTFTMSHARCVEKIQNATQGIKDAGWGSMNQFLLAFYTSDNPEVLQQSRSSLSYTEGQSFAPEKILDAWLKNGPTGNSRDQLHLGGDENMYQNIVLNFLCNAATTVLVLLTFVYYYKIL